LVGEKGGQKAARREKGGAVRSEARESAIVANSNSADIEKKFSVVQGETLVKGYAAGTASRD